MANMSQMTPYTKLKQSTEMDARNFGPLVASYESQTSTAAQTIITLTKFVCNLDNKNSVMLYIDGQLLTEGSGNDYTWTNVSDNTSNQITLAASLTAGLNIQVYKLGVTSPNVVNTDTIQASMLSLIPAGAIMEWGGPNDPTIGWFICDGRAISRSTYSNLFTAIGTSFGSGDGSTTFNLPDKRGVFSRGDIRVTTVTGSGTVTVTNDATFSAHNINRTGFKVRLQSGTLTGLAAATDYYAIVVDANTLAFATTYNNALAGTKIAISGVNAAVITQWEDPDAATRLQAAVGGNTSGVGTRQDSELKSHTHTDRYHTNTLGTGGFAGSEGSRGAYANTNTGLTGGNETRPLNIYTNYIIKY